MTQSTEYPHALVPGACTSTDIFNAWEAKGLEPIEIASEDAEQIISIKHNAVTGQLEWTTRKMDGIQALGVMVSALHDMFRQFIKNVGRPGFSSGRASVAIKLDDQTLTVGLDRLDDPTVLKGMVAAALWEIIERAEHNDASREWLNIFTTKI